MVTGEVRVAVVGAGTWGTTFARLLAASHPVTLWARRAELASAMASTGENPEYLPGHRLPPTLRASASLADTCRGATVVVLAVPSHGMRGVLEAAAPWIPHDAAVVSLTKGVERGTLARMTEVVREVVPGVDPGRLGVLTGPNLAREVAAGQPTATVVAVPDDDVCRWLQQAFMAPTLRVYTNPDVVGCELAGALKNVLAIAAGIAHGLGYGHNTTAALITRGLAELARLGVALGGEPLTFAGLAGMGDVVATCSSPDSRNRSVGVELGRGRSLDEILASTRMVAEGVRTTSAVLELARRVEVEVPIAEIVEEVLHGGRHPRELVPELMERSAKPELHGMAPHAAADG